MNSELKFRFFFFSEVQPVWCKAYAYHGVWCSYPTISLSSYSIVSFFYSILFLALFQQVNMSLEYVTVTGIVTVDRAIAVDRWVYFDFLSCLYNTR